MNTLEKEEITTTTDFSEQLIPAIKHCCESQFLIEDVLEEH